MSENSILVDDRYGAGDGFVHSDAEHLDDGGIVFSDYYTTISDGINGNWLGLAVDGAADALDTLAFVEDPLQGLISAGIGWLIEHVSFLSEPLDYLAGNPDFVQQKSQTWKNIKESLEKAAQDYDTSSQALLQQYQGSAATAYGNAARNFSGGMTSTAAHADNAATAMTVAAVIVGATRGLVRDWISTFVAQAVEKAAIAIATSFLDFGASLAAYIADEVYEGSILAEKTASKLTEITDKLHSLSSIAEKDASTLTKATTSLQKDATKLSKQTTKAVSKTDASVKAMSTPAKQAFKDAEKGGFTSAATSHALKVNREATQDLQHTLDELTSVRRAAAEASTADGVGRATTGLGNNAAQAGKTERSVQKQIDELTQQRHDLTAHRLHVGDESIEQTHKGLHDRVTDAAGDATKDAAKHVPVEAGRQGYNERRAREEAAETEQERRDELPDGSLVEE